MQGSGRIYHWVVRAALVLAVTLVSVNCAGREAMRRAVSVPRNPATGIMLGAEPVAIDRGSRGACLLLHGWLGSPADFTTLPAALAEAGWDVYVPLHPGHGTQPSDLEGITAEKLLAGARGHYDSLRSRYDRVVLVGFSMGGSMATILAAEEPPDMLVLIAPFYAVTHKWYYILPARWWHAMLSCVVRYIPRDTSFLRVNRAEAREDIVTYNAFPIDITKALFTLRRIAVKQADVSRLTMPVLVVYAPKDQVAASSAIDAYLERMPAQTKERFACPRSDHYILYDYDAEEAVAAIVGFVRRP